MAGRIVSPCAVVLLTLGVAAGAAAARDPGPVDTGARGSRGTSSAGRADVVPQRLDRARPHGRPLEPAGERRRLYEQVEADADRGRGRIEDDATYDARRIQDARDERLGRIAARREFERFREEHDRRQRLEARAARARTAAREAASPSSRAARESVTQPPASAVASPLARFVAEEEQRLDAARQRYQDDLRVAEAERDAALRAAATQDARSRASRRFVERRAALTREYQAYRRTILGSD